MYEFATFIQGVYEVPIIHSFIEPLSSKPVPAIVSSSYETQFLSKTTTFFGEDPNSQGITRCRFLFTFGNGWFAW